MEWINIEDKTPKDGKCVVRTETPLKNSNIFECVFNSKTKKFHCSGQIVTHWLDGDFDFNKDLNNRIKNKK